MDKCGDGLVIVAQEIGMMSICREPLDSVGNQLLQTDNICIVMHTLFNGECVSKSHYFALVIETKAFQRPVKLLGY